MDATVTPEPLEALLARLDRQPHALLALGIPRCPACRLLPATLGALAASRPDLAVGLALFADPAEWVERERLLWPRGIRVSRASVPVLVLLRDGRMVAQRPGSAPAHLLEAWLDAHLAPRAVAPIAGPTAAERATLREMAPRRAQHEVVRERRAG